MRRFLPILAALAAMLAIAIALSYEVWTTVGDAGMTGNGVTALVLGVIGSLILGGGLMALVFFSSRRGYDDAADLAVGKDKKRS